MNNNILEAQFALDENNIYQLIDLKLNNEACVFHMLFFVNEDSRYYCNLLDIFYVDIVNFLGDNGITPSISLKNGTCANVLAEVNGRKVEFVNWKSKFNVDFADDYQRNLKLLKYAEAHGHDGMSLGHDAYLAFLRSFLGEKESDAKLFAVSRKDQFLPVFDYDFMLLDAKRNAYGYQMATKGTFFDVKEYDISGSYPSSALNDLPEGLPHYYDNMADVPRSYFKVVNFTFNDLNVKGLDWLNLSHTTRGSLSLTERLFEQFKKDYTTNIHVKRIEAFKTHKSMMRQFITDTVIKGKQDEHDPDIRSYNKALGNAVIGYLGRNTTTSKTAVKFDLHGTKFEPVEEVIEPVYLPAHLAILDASKARFLEVVRKHKGTIIYANTDGFFTHDTLDLHELNKANSNKVVGNFKLKHHFARIRIEGLNQIAAVTTDGELINTISGLTRKELVTPEQFERHAVTYCMNIRTADGRHIMLQEVSHEQP